MIPYLEKIANKKDQPSLNTFEVLLGKQPSNWHYHPEIELTYVVSGHGIRLVGEHIGSFNAGDVLLTGKNLPHDFMVNNDEDEAEFIVIQFQESLVERFPEFASITRLIKLASRGALFHSPSLFVTSLLNQFNQQQPAQKLIDLLRVLDDLSQENNVMSLCSSSYGAQQLGQVQRHRLNHVIDFIQNNYMRSISLGEMASLTFMTEPSFCRWFKQTMDCSFINFLNKCRIEHANRLLISTDLQIAFIGQQCGFESLSSFNRAFKKHTDVSPMQYRKKMRAE